MKKILLLVSLLVVAAACAAPPTNQGVTTTNTSVAESKPVAMTETGAISNEKAIWDAIKAKDYDAFGNMLAADQLEVMGEGINDKAASIAGVKDFEPTDVALSDWKFLSIDDDAYVIVYTANVKGKYKGKEFPAMNARSSSAWVNRDGKWLAIYHQECEVKPAPASPAKTNSSAKANTNSSAKPESSPAAAVAATSDAIANEKMVWDLFKSKNYEGFASLLAANFIEVEPDMVTDKAGSVAGVQGFDATKATLSDWKTATIDDDATLVTYTVKVAGAPGMGERHSTIWANQDGKWLALFHQGGTAVVAAMAASPSASASPKASASPAMKTAASPAAKASPSAKPSATK